VTWWHCDWVYIRYLGRRWVCSANSRSVSPPTSTWKSRNAGPTPINQGLALGLACAKVAICVGWSIAYEKQRHDGLELTLYASAMPEHNPSVHP